MKVGASLCEVLLLVSVLCENTLSDWIGQIIFLFEKCQDTFLVSLKTAAFLYSPFNDVHDSIYMN